MVIRGIEDFAYSNGYNVIICSTHESYEREVLILGMMVAAKQNEEDGLSEGERLAILLESLGPLAIKAGQKAALDPRVDPEIAKGLERLLHAAKPFDYRNIHDLIGREPELAAQIKRTGKILGSGSVFVVVEVELHNGETEVLALLRDHTEELIAADLYTFNNYLKLISDDEDPNIELFRQILNHGKKASLDEANTTLAKEQHEIAGVNYNGSGAIVEDLEVKFKACELTGSGKLHKRMKKANGVLFSQLPTTTPEEIEFKRKVGKAIVAKELELILAGKPFDIDRHISNSLIERQGDIAIVTHIDFGGQQISPPTTEDLETLGAILGSAMLYARKDGDFLGGLKRAMDKQVKSFTPYLSNLNNALLALKGQLKLSAPDDLIDVMHAATSRGLNDQVEKIMDNSLKRNFLSYRIGRLLRLISPPRQVLNGKSKDSVQLT